MQLRLLYGCAIVAVWCHRDVLLFLFFPSMHLDDIVNNGDSFRK